MGQRSARFAGGLTTRAYGAAVALWTDPVLCPEVVPGTADDDPVGIGPGTAEAEFVVESAGLEVVVWETVCGALWTGGGGGVVVRVARGDGVGVGVRAGTRRRVAEAGGVGTTTESAAAARLRAGVPSGLAEADRPGSLASATSGLALSEPTPEPAVDSGPADEPGIASASGMTAAAAPPPASTPTARTLTR